MYNNIKQAVNDVVNKTGNYNDKKLKSIYTILNSNLTNPNFFIHCVCVLTDFLYIQNNTKQIKQFVNKLTEERTLDLLGDKVSYLLIESKDIFETIFFELICLYYSKEDKQEVFLTTIKKYHHFEKARHTMMFRDIIIAYFLVLSFLDDMQTLPFYCWSIVMMQDYKYGVKHFDEIIEKSKTFCYELDLNLNEKNKVFSEHYETMYLKYQCN